MPFPARLCRGCGCTDDRACPGGCSWVLLDVDTPTGVCSTCAEEVAWDPKVLIAIGVDGDFPLADPLDDPIGSMRFRVSPPRILLP